MYYGNYNSGFENGYGLNNVANTYSSFNDFNGLNSFDAYSRMRNVSNLGYSGNMGNMGNMFSSGNMSQGMLGSGTKSTLGKIGLFSRLAKGINWNDLLNNTSRTLNIVNQAIPIVNQAKPLVNNMKTMLKIANIMKEDSHGNSVNINNEKGSKKNVIRKTEINKINGYDNDNQPTFFL